MNKMIFSKLRTQLLNKGLKGRLVKAGMGTFAIKIAGTGCSFLLAVIIARSLGPEGYGVYSFAIAITSLAAIVSQVGLPNLVVRETAKKQVNQQWALLKGLWQWSNLIVWVSSSFIAVITIIGVWSFGSAISYEQRMTLLVGLLLVPFVALGNLRGAALRGLGRVILGELPDSIVRPSILMLMVVSASWFAGTISPVKTMWLHIIAAATTFIFGSLLLLQARPKPVKSVAKRQYESGAWLASALPLAMVTGLQLVNNQTDIVMLGILQPAEQVGIYKVAASSVVIVTFGLGVVNTVITPYFASLHAQNDTIRLQKAVTMSARMSLLMALPLAIIVFIWGDHLLGFIFGFKFAVGHMALNILIVGQLLNISMGLTSGLLMMTGNEKYALISIIMSVLLNIGLNAALIPLLGIIGAAMATVVALLLWKLYLIFLVKKKLCIHPSIF